MSTLTHTRIPFVTTTEMRKNIAAYIGGIRRKGGLLGIGRRDKIEVVIMKYPEVLNDKLNEITNINANSRAFDFLSDEPDLYTVNDLKKRYV